MREPLRMARGWRAARDSGFTLIEVLAVVVIIGILVAISIPLYMNYTKGAANKAAESDVRGAITAVEQFYSENANQYPGTANTAVTSGVGANLEFAAIGTGTKQTASVSEGNTIAFQWFDTATENYYVICGQNKDGKTIYFYNSGKGGPVKKSDQTTLANCVANGH